MSIMDSHEQYCEQLKKEILRYTDQELFKGYKLSDNRKNCEDYAKIYKIELDRRALTTQ